LRIENIYKSFGETRVLTGISLTVQPQEVVVLVGPSGSGKSTLLRCINLLSPPDSGRIWLEEQEITAPGVNPDKVRQRIGMVSVCRRGRVVARGCAAVVGQRRHKQVMRDDVRVHERFRGCW
jgi:ABC-type histidine transport system ATPase subunit